MTERRHDRYLPGFADMARRRRALAEDLVARRMAMGLSQTEVAARMGTSQSAVARLESGQGDVRLSSIERYAAAVDQVIDWRLGRPDDEDGRRVQSPGSALGGTGPPRAGRGAEPGAGSGPPPGRQGLAVTGRSRSEDPDPSAERALVDEVVRR